MVVFPQVGLTRTIHKFYRALACSFARNESLIPLGIFSCASAIHLISRLYADHPIRGRRVKSQSEFVYSVFTLFRLGSLFFQYKCHGRIIGATLQVDIDCSGGGQYAADA